MKNARATKSDFFRNKKDRVFLINKENRQDEIRLVVSLLVRENKDFFLSVMDVMDDSIERINHLNDKIVEMDKELVKQIPQKNARS